MGRPRKKDPAVVKVAEAMGIRLSADVMTLEELDGFPDLKSESNRNQAIMCMWACGFPQSHIADSFGIKQPTVWEIIHRIDPMGRFKISQKGKKAFITKMAQGIAQTAMNSISLEDLLELNAKDRTAVAGAMMKISADLNQTKHKEIGGSKLDILMDEMARASVEEGEVIAE